MNNNEKQKDSILSKMDLNRISQPAVKKLINRHISEGMDQFDDIVSTYKKEDDLSNYSIHNASYSYPINRDEVWQHYIDGNPSEAWNGKLLSFGVLISKDSESVLYSGGKYEGAKGGQVLYLNLNLLLGQFQLAVAHEIIEVNHEEKYMDLSYVVGADSVGMQHIEFIDNQDGTSLVKHTTYYRSDSKFRDKVIYPYFHTKVVNDYHNNMRLILKDLKE
jgi:hypothetical protein